MTKNKLIYSILITFLLIFLNSNICFSVEDYGLSLEDNILQDSFTEFIDLNADNSYSIISSHIKDGVFTENVDTDDNFIEFDTIKVQNDETLYDPIDFSWSMSPYNAYNFDSSQEGEIFYYEYDTNSYDIRFSGYITPNQDIYLDYTDGGAFDWWGLFSVGVYDVLNGEYDFAYRLYHRCDGINGIASNEFYIYDTYNDDFIQLDKNFYEIYNQDVVDEIGYKINVASGFTDNNGKFSAVYGLPTSNYKMDYYNPVTESMESTSKHMFYSDTTSTSTTSIWGDVVINYDEVVRLNNTLTDVNIDTNNESLYYTNYFEKDYMFKYAEDMTIEFFVNGIKRVYGANDFASNTVGMFGEVGIELYANNSFRFMGYKDGIVKNLSVIGHSYLGLTQEQKEANTFGYDMNPINITFLEADTNTANIKGNIYTRNLKNTSSENILKYASVILRNQSNSNYIDEVTTDVNGSFLFTNVDLNGNYKVYLYTPTTEYILESYIYTDYPITYDIGDNYIGNYEPFITDLVLNDVYLNFFDDINIDTQLYFGEYISSDYYGYYDYLELNISNSLIYQNSSGVIGNLIYNFSDNYLKLKSNGVINESITIKAVQIPFNISGNYRTSELNFNVYSMETLPIIKKDNIEDLNLNSNDGFRSFILNNYYSNFNSISLDFEDVNGITQNLLININDDDLIYNENGLIVKLLTFDNNSVLYIDCEDVEKNFISSFNLLISNDDNNYLDSFSLNYEYIEKDFLNDLFSNFLPNFNLNEGSNNIFIGIVIIFILSIGVFLITNETTISLVTTFLSFLLVVAIGLIPVSFLIIGILMVIGVVVLFRGR